MPIIPVGIDLGTSLCAVSVIDASGQTQMIPNEDGEILTPSAVYFDDDQIVVGNSAWQAALDDPDRVAEHAKRDMGSGKYRRQIGGHNYPPEVIQSCLLRRLRQDISGAVSEEFQVVITVPAYFDESRRKATCDAAIMSDVPLLDIVNEPTAAALSFGEKLGYLNPQGTPSECLNILVYDLGGGTFDVTLIRLTSAEVRTLATDGDCELGGLDWDERLAQHVWTRFKALWPDAQPLQQLDETRLLRAARIAKHALSSQPLTVVEFSHGGRDLKLPVLREEFEDLCADLLERTLFTTKQTLKAAGLIWKDIDRLLLVGGSSRMPAVRRALKELSGIEPDVAVNPDEAVARGAAIYARYLLSAKGVETTASKLQIVNVNSHGLGIEGVNLETLRTENVTLIARNTPLPCEVKRTFVTRSDNQRSVKIQLLEGESSLPGQCSPLAAAMIRNLPPGLPKGTTVNVSYALQPNGRLEVTASVPSHGEHAQIELQRVRGLADKRVRRWKRIVCRNGGYGSYIEALTAFLEYDDKVLNEPDDEGVVDTLPKKEKTVSAIDLEPAVNFGAPRAAAETLQNTVFGSPQQGISIPNSTSTDFDLDERAPWPGKDRNRRKSGSSPLVNAAGYIGGAILGLMIGYVVLCWIRPELNLFGSNQPASHDEVHRDKSASP